jgi:tRNA pseudouridine55 synthase
MKKEMGSNGILNINKPEGKSSFAVVAGLKRLTGERHVGHTGTLDPMATGVLPVCFGQATRIARFIVDFNKSYIAQIELGTVTDTFDREGTVTEQNSPGDITKETVLHTLSSFQGEITQVPPKYSALKYKGKRYYELARAGIAIEPKPRQVKIHHIELLDYQFPIITIQVDCSKGTYIRSLAHDIGQSFGCGAFLRELVRVASGPFRIEDSLSMTEVEDACTKGVWREMLYPVDGPLSYLQAITVDEKDEKSIRNGCSIGLEDAHLLQSEYCRAYDSRGNFIAILRYLSSKKCWHPDRVFSF